MGVFNTKDFIKKSKEIYGCKYDYSKVEYKNSHEKICIICHEKDEKGNEHGEFWQTPNSHLNGCGCPKCGKNKKLTTEDFIAKARSIHGDKYDYSKVEYKNANTKVCIICPEHGEFWQKPSNHLVGKGCKLCSIKKGKKIKKYDTESLIIKIKEIHGDEYDYSKVEYKTLYDDIILICSKHGEFAIKPSQLLYEKQGCPICNNKLKKLTTEEFIAKARSIHGDKYDYSKVEYKNNKQKVCIICPEHGEFWQRGDLHLNGCGCLECSNTIKHENKKQTTLQFVEKAKNVHGNKYDYSKTVYLGRNSKLIITCPEHGDFWQKPYSHLNGHGCPKCNYSHLERNIEQLLLNNNIFFEQQKSFEWLKYINSLTLDFYLPDKKIAIECQGAQHFYPCNRYGGEKAFEEIVIRDKTKYKLLEEHGIKLIYYTTKQQYKTNNFYNDKKLYMSNKEILNFINYEHY